MTKITSPDKYFSSKKWASAPESPQRTIVLRGPYVCRLPCVLCTTGRLEVKWRSCWSPSRLLGRRFLRGPCLENHSLRFVTNLESNGTLESNSSRAKVLSFMGSPTCRACIGFPMRFVFPNLSPPYLLKISTNLPKIDWG